MTWTQTHHKIWISCTQHKKPCHSLLIDAGEIAVVRSDGYVDTRPMTTVILKNGKEIAVSESYEDIQKAILGEKNDPPRDHR